jgi:hypothetical protein
LREAQISGLARPDRLLDANHANCGQPLPCGLNHHRLSRPIVNDQNLEDGRSRSALVCRNRRQQMLHSLSTVSNRDDQSDLLTRRNSSGQIGSRVQQASVLPSIDEITFGRTRFEWLAQLNSIHERCACRCQ